MSIIISNVPHYLHYLLRVGDDLNVVSTEMQNLKENERHLRELLDNERQVVESKTKSIKKMESVLKAVTANNDEMKQKNVSLYMQVRINKIIYTLISPPTICYLLFVYNRLRSWWKNITTRRTE